MRMLATRKHMQLLIHATPQRTLGQHALDGKLDRALRVLGQQLLQADRLQVTDITCVVVILLLRQLVAGDADLLGIDHNDVIAGVDVWTVDSLVFATQPHGDLGRKPTQHLVGCVDHKPITAHLARLRKYCSHLLKLRPSPRAADLRQVGHRKKGRNLTQALAPLQNQYCRGSGGGPLAYNLPMSPSENAGRPPLGPLDDLLAAAGRGLKTLLAPPAAKRPVPAGAASAASAALPLAVAERQLAADLMRVNHAGEIAAQALYHAQSLTARDHKTREFLLRAAREEGDHLAWCAERLRELDDRPSFLTPVWYLASFAIGTLAGALGDRASLGFVAETERQVESHLRGHLDKLPLADSRSRAIVEAMREDETGHGQEAMAAGGVELPPPARALMRMAARVMTATAARL